MEEEVEEEEEGAMKSNGNGTLQRITPSLREAKRSALEHKNDKKRRR